MRLAVFKGDNDSLLLNLSEVRNLHLVDFLCKYCNYKLDKTIEDGFLIYNIFIKED